MNVRECANLPFYIKKGTEMKLEELGFTEKIADYISQNELDSYQAGRVIAEHKESYVIRTETGDFDAEVTGNLRFSARGREDFPAVGDWVAVTVYDHDFSIIHKVLPRTSLISRQAVGHHGELQIIAANIDFAFIVQAADRDFNINRLERYLTICHSAKVAPLIVLTKIDLINEEELNSLIGTVQRRIGDVPVIAVSSTTLDGYETLESAIQKGKTYCMLGSSGVGKSTLINRLAGREMMRTEAISSSVNKGRHTTTHRELLVLENGGIFIDNPGMREVGIGDLDGGLEQTFDRITTLALSCKFRDCTHMNETGCAVIAAVENGTLDRKSYENYLKMGRERTHFEQSTAERRKKDKNFGKMLKEYKKKNKS